MKIDTFSLKEGKNPFHLEESAAILELSQELVFQSPVKLEGFVLKQGPRLIVKATIKLTLEVECSRCLTSFSLPLNVPLETYYTIGDEGTTDQKQSECIQISSTEQSINFISQIREGIILAIPLKLLCHEKCKGLCPRCGVNLNTESCKCMAHQRDPRWARLEAWRSETN